MERKLFHLSSSQSFFAANYPNKPQVYVCKAKGRLHNQTSTRAKSRGTKELEMLGVVSLLWVMLSVNLTLLQVVASWPPACQSVNPLTHLSHQDPKVAVMPCLRIQPLLDHHHS